MRYSIIALVLVLAFSFGCTKVVTEGRKINAENTKFLLRPGVDRAGVEKIYGEPQKKETLPTGEVKYTYYYKFERPYWWTADDEMNQRLEVVFKGDQVQRYHYRDVSQNPIQDSIPVIPPPKL